MTWVRIFGTAVRIFGIGDLKWPLLDKRTIGRPPYERSHKGLVSSIHKGGWTLDESFPGLYIFIIFFWDIFDFFFYFLARGLFF